MGRPSTFTDELFETICIRLENGEVLRAICDDDEMPDRSTVLRWIANDDGKRRRYDVARQACVEYWSDEIIGIATDGSRDTITDEKGRERCDHEWVARSRLRIDTIKFLMTKINPLKWGDKLPEATAARQIEIDAQKETAEQIRLKPLKIEIVAIKAGDLKQNADGEWVPTDMEDLKAKIRELEAELAGRTPRPAPPALLTYDSGPLPARMDRDIASRMVRLIKGYVHKDDQRPSETVLDEVLSVCRNGLSEFYGPAGELVDSSLAAE